MQDSNGISTVTRGRLRYLEQAGIERTGPNWWQAPVPPEDAGRLDYLTTLDAWQRVEVPKEMLGEGMEPYREAVDFLGAPLADAIGNADTVMERRGEFVLDDPVATRLVAFGNVSEKPIELKGEGELAGAYHLFVTLSPTEESPGEMTFFADSDLGGTFRSTISLAPLFELRPVTGGDSIYVDTAQVELPGFPMELASSGGHWAQKPARPDAIGEVDASLFYPGKVSIITQKLMPGPAGFVDVLAGCNKAQASGPAETV